MTSHLLPVDIDLVDTRKSGAFGLLIRHAAREPITKDNINLLGAQLTDAGRMQAEALGNRLRGLRHHAFYSSPVKRCVDTNVCILKGLGMHPEEAQRLAEPRDILAEAFMDEPNAAKNVFRLQEPEQVILNYLAGQKVTGFGSVEWGTARLLDFIRNTIVPGTFSVFATHDAVVMPFRQHLLGDVYSRERWLPFLGGCVIYTEGAGIWVDGRPL